MFQKIRKKVRSIVTEEFSQAENSTPVTPPGAPQIQFTLSTSQTKSRHSEELLTHAHPDCSRDDGSGSHGMPYHSPYHPHMHPAHPPRAPRYHSQPLSGKSHPEGLGGACLLGQGFSEVRDKYFLGGELGRGLQGVTRLCSERETGYKFACKSIAKHLIRKKEHAEAIITEVKALERLADEPSIIGVKDVYEDQLKIHLVMELCEGGDLFARIKERKRFGERESALVLKQVASALKACHEAGVVHRDLKPENILLCSRESDTDIKLADFGVAAFIKPGETLTTVAGSPYYVSPEVLKGCYGPEADVWSAGVVLHIMLSGRPPFWHRDIESIFRAIREADVTLSAPVWKTVSPSAKELVLSMLTRDRAKRITPSEILEHPWILEYTKDMPFDHPLLTKSSSFTESSVLPSPSSESGFSSRRGSMFGSSRHLILPSSPSNVDLESMSFGGCTTSSTEFNWVSFDQVADPNKEEISSLLNKEFQELMAESKAHMKPKDEETVVKTNMINPADIENFELHLDLNSRRLGLRIIKSTPEDETL